MKISQSLISQYHGSHQNIKKDRLPALRTSSLPQLSPASRSGLPITLLPDPSNEQYLKDFYKNLLETLVSDMIDHKRFLSMAPSPVSSLRETQIAAYKRAGELSSAVEDRTLPRIDLFL